MPPRWFARVDANADGSLSREELTKHPGRGDGGPQNGKLARMDQNSDGKVDAAELKNSAEQMLKRMDQNSDGVLDATELQRRGRHGGHGGRGDAKPGNDLPAGTTRS
jgi:Ca2+-binding EF-hand superfamily protein